MRALVFRTNITAFSSVIFLLCCLDKKLLDKIVTDLEIELNDNPDAENFLSFFDLKPETAANNVLVVDRGFEGATEEYMTLLAPKERRNPSKMVRPKSQSNTPKSKQEQTEQ